MMKASSSSPQTFFLALGSMVALVVLVISIIGVIFQVANNYFADPLIGFQDPYASGLRLFLSLLIVSYPLFTGLVWYTRTDALRLQTIHNSWIYRWLTYLGLFVVSAVSLITIVVVLNNFLSGEVTSRFAVKSLATLAVMILAGSYLSADLRERWNRPDTQKELTVFGSVVSVGLLALIVGGMMIVGTPQSVRLLRFDQQKISHLQDIQWRILDHYQTKGSLPQNLSDLVDDLNGYEIPVDPQTQTPYQYRKEKGLSFTLCATFNRESAETQGQMEAYPYPASIVEPKFSGSITESRWEHPAGEHCYTRTIDPTRYPVHK